MIKRRQPFMIPLYTLWTNRLPRYYIVSQSIGDQKYFTFREGERGCLVVEPRTPEREVGGSKLAPPCCVL